MTPEQRGAHLLLASLSEDPVGAILDLLERDPVLADACANDPESRTMLRELGIRFAVVVDNPADPAEA